MKQLLETGVHFGHQSRRWNPKMKKYIFMERSGIHIIDLQQTMELIEVAYKYAKEITSQGKIILFVGTKKQIQEVIYNHAKRCDTPYVNHRWIGGTITNFTSIKGRTEKLKELEQLVESESFEKFNKKEASRINHKLFRLKKLFNGIRDLERIPDVLFIIDPEKEINALKEASKMEIPIIAVVDTNCDPDLIDYIIPGNDDAIRAVDTLISVIADAVIAGKAEIAPPVELDEEEEIEEEIEVIELKKKPEKKAEVKLKEKHEEKLTKETKEEVLVKEKIEEKEEEIEEKVKTVESKEKLKEEPKEELKGKTSKKSEDKPKKKSVKKPKKKIKEKPVEDDKEEIISKEKSEEIKEEKSETDDKTTKKRKKEE